MNKKLLLGMFAAAGMLFATSCSNDELDVVQSGNEATVSFTLGVEGGVQTRAISDGLTANRLVYAVFDEEGNRITTIAKVDKEANFPTTENITLAKGQTYKVAFWAQNSATSAYVLDDDMNLTIDYTNSENNDENRDAFFKTETFTVTGNAQINVVLKRPFAQINLGVTDTDWDAAVASGIEIATSKVVIKNAFTNMDLIDGSVSGETEVVYDFGATPKSSNEVLKVDLDKDGTAEEYQYLSMSYILVDAQKSTLQDLDFTFHPISGNDIVFGEGLNNVPVQRNWRTNIIGQILTGNIDFNISIDPIYDGEYNNGTAVPVELKGVYYSTIEDALANAVDGDVINLGVSNYTLPSNIKLKDGATGTITFVGEGEKTVINGSANASGITVIMKDLTWTSPSTGYDTAFTHATSVSFENCNITGQYYAQSGRDIDIIKLNGSIEIAPILGLSDVIVDLVEIPQIFLKILRREHHRQADFLSRSQYKIQRHARHPLRGRLAAAVYAQENHVPLFDMECPAVHLILRTALQNKRQSIFCKLCIVQLPAGRTVLPYKIDQRGVQKLRHGENPLFLNISISGFILLPHYNPPFLCKNL